MYGKPKSRNSPGADKRTFQTNSSPLFYGVVTPTLSIIYSLRNRREGCCLERRTLSESEILQGMTWRTLLWFSPPWRKGLHSLQLPSKPTSQLNENGLCPKAYFQGMYLLFRVYLQGLYMSDIQQMPDNKSLTLNDRDILNTWRQMETHEAILRRQGPLEQA